jgi:FkbM family methyltransferase
MPAPRMLKRIAQNFGVFSQARALYRRLSPEVRRGLQVDNELYGRFVSPGDLVFDIGANLGQKSEVFLELGARVVGVEPNPCCKAVLHNLLGHNTRFTHVPQAVGSGNGTASLTFVSTSSTASLRSDWAYITLDGENASKVDVEVTTLDTLVGRFGMPSFCKIDVEGFEIEALKGLSAMPKMLTFEYHVEELDEFNACLDRLLAIGATQANIIPMNEGHFVLSDWKAIDELRAVAASGSVPSVGDIFCRP